MSETDVAAVVARFGSHELAIRRLHSSSREFRAVCEDYAIASRALAKWEDDQSKAQDYQLLIEELEDEVLEFLEGRHPHHETARHR